MPSVIKKVNEEILRRVQEIIALETGIDPIDIQPHTDLFEELQLSTETVFPIIIKRINAAMQTSLKADDLVDEVETISELIDVIEDEMELG